MERNELLKQINEIFIDILEDDNLVLSEATSANDVEDWDSLSHIRLVVAIEKHFKIRFTSSEIQNWKNVGEIISSIETK